MVAPDSEPLESLEDDTPVEFGDPKVWCLEVHPGYRKWLVTPVYKSFRPFGRGTTLLRGLTNHGYQPLTSPGMILQVLFFSVEGR